MIATERQRRICELVERDGVVSVASLASFFGVSEMTVRRDLERCEQDGCLSRCHGGAVFRNSNVRNPDNASPESSARSKLAQRALQFIKESDTIFLDTGTTMMHLAQSVISMPSIKVITNDLSIAIMLSSNDINVTILGGTIQNHIGGVCGYTAQQMLDDFYVETAFTSGYAVDEKFSLLVPTEEKAFFHRKLIKKAKRSYILLNEAKFSRHSMYYIHNLNSYTGVITDKVFNSEQRSLIDDLGINIITQ